MEKNNSIAFSRKITGNAKIDEKIEEWLRLDKVDYLKMDLHVQLYNYALCMSIKLYFDCHVVLW